MSSVLQPDFGLTTSIHHNVLTKAFYFISSRVCNQSRRLRQFSVRKCAENLERQTAAGHEHCGAIVVSGTRKFDRGLTRLLHEDLHWLDIPQRITFKLCLKLGFQVFTRLCTAVSRRTMRTGRRRNGAPQSALRHSRSTIPLVQHDKLRPTSIFVRRPSCLELTARTFATNHFNRTFQALSKTFLFAQIARSAH